MRTILYFIIYFVLVVSQITNAQVITTIAGNGTAGNDSLGVEATTAQLNMPAGVVMDKYYNIYILNHTGGVVRKITPAGIITTVGGGGTSIPGDDSLATNAFINSPYSIAVDNSLNLYIAENGNFRIRKINPSGIITTFAGGGTGGDGGLATNAQLADPTGVAVDRYGNVYIADGISSCIKKVNTSGIITTIAGSCGNPGYSGDGGPATDASLYYPQGISLDTAGNLYIADWNNSCIRKIDTSGNIYTVAGIIGSPDYLGDGGPATDASINMPTDVKTDNYGNIYICDQANHVIRKINNSGIISTICGNGSTGFGGDGGPATNAKLNLPFGIAAFGKGNVLIADEYNNRVRRVWTNSVGFPNGHTQNFSLCDSERSADISSILSVVDSNQGLSIAWSVMDTPKHGNIFTYSTSTSTCGFITPYDLGYTSDSGYIGTDSFKILVSDGISFDSTKVRIRRVSFPVPGTISGATTVCVGNTISLSETVAGGTWSLSNNKATNFHATVTGVTTGTDTLIYTVTNSCGTVASRHIISVNQRPITGPISGHTNICISATDTLSDTSAGGSWRCSNTIATIASGILHPVMAGVDTISYAVTNGCGTTTRQAIITIASPPNAGIITGDTSLCESLHITLSVSATGGVWSCTNTAAYIPGPGIVYGLHSGTDTALYSVTNACGIAVASHGILVIPNTAGTITGPGYVCTGDSILLSDTTTNISGIWHVSNNHASVSGGSVSGISVGKDTVYYTVTHSCGPLYASHVVTVKPLPNPGSITGEDTVCLGGTVTLSGTIHNGIWSTYNNRALVNDSGLAAGRRSGNDTIIYTVSSGFCTASAYKYIWVKPFPVAGVILGQLSLCTGQSVTFTDTVGTGIWGSANNSVQLAPYDSFAVITGQDAGENIIFFSKSNECGSTTISKVISILPQPATGVILGPTGFCQGDSISLTATTQGGVWSTGNDPDIMILADSSVLVVSASKAGLDTIYYTISNTCGSFSTSLAIQVNMNPANGGITGDSVICAGNTGILVGLPAGGSWSTVTGNTIVNKGVITGLTPGADTIVYTITNNCGSAIDSFPITVISQGPGCIPLNTVERTGNVFDIEIFPNPAVGQLSLKINNCINTTISVKIKDIIGMSVYRHDFPNTNSEIKNVPLSDLAPGVYIIEITAGSQHAINRFVKE